MLKRIFLIGSLVTAITSGMLFTASTAEAQRWRGRVWVDPFVRVDTSFDNRYYYPSSYYTDYRFYYDPAPTYHYTYPTYTYPTYTYPSYYYSNRWYPGYYMDRYPWRTRW